MSAPCRHVIDAYRAMLDAGVTIGAYEDPSLACAKCADDWDLYEVEAAMKPKTSAASIAVMYAERDYETRPIGATVIPLVPATAEEIRAVVGRMKRGSPILDEIVMDVALPIGSAPCEMLGNAARYGSCVVDDAGVRWRVEAHEAEAAEHGTAHRRFTLRRA